LFHCTQEDLIEEEEFEPIVQHAKPTMAKKPLSDDEGSIIILDSDSDEGKVSTQHRETSHKMYRGPLSVYLSD
jgi:hypothetical protein